MDADIQIAGDYFESLIHAMQKNPNVGIGGGKLFHRHGKTTKYEEPGPDHVRGAFKVYRKAFWDQINGLEITPGWDVIDEYNAQTLGWDVVVFPNIKALQVRKTGSRIGFWKANSYRGHANYYTGYHPIFMLAKCAKRLFEWPYVLVSLSLFYGYFSAYFMKIERYQNTKVLDYVAKKQKRRLKGFF